MTKVTQEAIQEQNPILWFLKFTNLFLKNNDVILKVPIEFLKDKLSELIKECNCICKQFDEIDENLDGNAREIKNNFVEILEEADLFLKNFDEDDQGESYKKLMNKIIELLIKKRT